MTSKIYRLFMVSVAMLFLLGFPECPPDGYKYKGTAPKWTMAPSEATALVGEEFSEVIARATDSDLPANFKNSPGRLFCSLKNNNCSFDVTVKGKGDGRVDCLASFPARAERVSCAIKIVVKDGSGNSISGEAKIKVKETLDISGCSPNPANEGDSVTCNVESDIGVPVIDILADTCGGAINGTGPYTYNFTAGEAIGPGECNAATMLATDNAIKDDEIISVNEINNAPTIAVDCPASMDEGAGAVCALTPVDSDLPASAATDPGFFSCSLDASSACASGAVINADCTQITLPTTMDPSVGSCAVTVNITDGYGATGQGSDTITINDLCFAPVITNLPYIYPGHWGNTGNFDVAVSDADIPTESQNFTLENNTCSFTPTIGAASGSVNWTCGDVENCWVDVRTTDHCPAGALSDVETLYIKCGNVPPSFTSSPEASVTEGVTYDYNVACANSDDDALILTQSPSNTCAGTLVDNGNGAGVFSFNPTETMGGGSCVIGLTCSDSQETVQQNSVVSIIEDNKSPTWNPAPTALWVYKDENLSYARGVADDLDIPPQNLTCSKTSQTCSFSVNISGSGVGGTDCVFSFNAPAAEDCQVEAAVSDGAGGVVNQTVPIHIVDAPCVIRVDSSATGAGTGINWTDAFTDLQEAVVRASPNCSVWVRDGVYLTGDTDPVLTMKDGVAIYGGFDTTETSPADRDLSANSTVLDGELLDKRIVVGASNARLDGFDIVNSRSSVIGGGFYSLDESGLYVDNCNFAENKTDNSGGAMANVNSSLTISNSTFSYNNAYYYYAAIGNGGGIYNVNSDSVVNDVEFYGNAAYYFGGGIFNSGGSLAISNTIFDQNKSDANHGGAIFNKNTQFYMNYGTLDNNVAFSNGGAICNYDTSSSIYNSEFYQNAASPTIYGMWPKYFNDYRGGYGGAIADFRSSLFVQGSLFDSNSALFFGGGVSVRSPSDDHYFYDNTFDNNEVTYWGGGLTFMDYDSTKEIIVISNNIFSENSAIATSSSFGGVGGGALVFGPEIYLSDSYFYSNHASTAGAGVSVTSDGAIVNCIFKNNDGPFLGGGLAVNAHENKLAVRNNLIVNNSATAGGGLAVFDIVPNSVGRIVHVVNSTIANNTATEYAGGIVHWTDDTDLTIYNSILFFNWGPQAYLNVYADESSMSIIYSDIQMSASSVYTGTGNINADPLFVGPTNYHLSHIAAGQAANSPCIDAANPSSSLYGTTRTDSVMDTIRVDMGFHFPIP